MIVKAKLKKINLIRVRVIKEQNVMKKNNVFLSKKINLLKIILNKEVVVLLNRFKLSKKKRRKVIVANPTLINVLLLQK